MLHYSNIPWRSKGPRLITRCSCYHTTEHTHIPRRPGLWHSQATPLLFCLWRLILSLPTTLTPFACPTTRSHRRKAIIVVTVPFSHYNDHQENFELSKGCYVKGWGKDIFGKEGEYQVLPPKDTLLGEYQVISLKGTLLGKYQVLTWKGTSLGEYQVYSLPLKE